MDLRVGPDLLSLFDREEAYGARRTSEYHPDVPHAGYFHDVLLHAGAKRVLDGLLGTKDVADDGVEPLLLPFVFEFAVGGEHSVLHVVGGGFFDGAFFEKDPRYYLQEILINGGDYIVRKKWYFVDPHGYVVVGFSVEHPEQSLRVTKRRQPNLRNVKSLLTTCGFGKADAPAVIGEIVFAERRWCEWKGCPVFSRNIHETHGSLGSVRVELLRVDVKFRVTR